MPSNGSSLFSTVVVSDVCPATHVESQMNPYWLNRNSSASLPLPSESYTPGSTTLPPPSTASPLGSSEQNLKVRPPSATDDAVESAPGSEQPPILLRYPRLASRPHRPPDIANLTASYPPPAPPTILTPPSTPPPCEGNHRPRLPYEPFLSNAPASDDCWIAVETLPSTYVLTVRLPGFRRDGM
jgi:hypothetical protein